MPLITYTDNVLEQIDLYRMGLITLDEARSALINEATTEGDKAAVEYLLLLMRAEVL